MMQGCLSVPGPPYFFMFKQFLQLPHSNARQPAQALQRCLRAILLGGWTLVVPLIVWV